MKNLGIILLSSLAFVACEKLDSKKDKTWDKDKDWKKDCEVCASDKWEDPTIESENIKVYEVEPLQYDADGCIIEGYVKYVENGKTASLVKYYTKDGITYGYKTYCVDGDCKDKNATNCEFEPQCER
jgi:hypothetical protein